MKFNLNMDKFPFGVNVSGLIRSEKGLGTAVRSDIEALKAARIPYILNNITDLGSTNVDKTFNDFSGENNYLFNLIHVNPDVFVNFANEANRPYFEGHYNIGYWVWELDIFPEEWVRFADYLDEIWTPSDFSFQAISKAILKTAKIPVTKIPHCISLSPDNIPIGKEAARRGLNIAADIFMFLFIFDFQSEIERKNPFAVVEAFKKAFSLTDKAMLFLKTSHSEFNKKEFYRLLNAVKGYNITIADSVFTKEQIYSLMNACDCYVSLHRSEGFGLTAAEAMALGKPVIATGYSGNMDFMNQDDGFPVSYRLVEVNGDYGAYKKGNMWAEPDLDEAADYMRYIFENGDKTAAVGTRGMDYIKKYFNKNIIGEKYKKRLNKIYYECDNLGYFLNAGKVKKILFIWNPDSLTFFGGGEKVLSTVLSNLLKSGYDIKVLVVVNQIEEINNEDSWAEVYKLYKSKMDFYPFSVNNFQNSIIESYKNFNPDISILAHPLIILSTFEALKAADIKTKIVYWDHGSLSNVYFSESKKSSSGSHFLEFIMESIKLCDGFLAISSDIEAKIKSIVPHAKVYTIFNPVGPYCGHLIKKPKEPFFIYVGRIDNKQKNISFLLYSLNTIKNLNWRLKLIGTGPNEVMLKDLSSRLNLNNKIEWAGFKSDPYVGLEEVTALLLTSRFEGLPMSLIEANQRGIPIISSDCETGPSDIVINGKNGYLYEEGNADDFIDILKRVISGDLTFDTSENIAETAERFNVEIYMKKFTGALDDIALS